MMVVSDELPGAIDIFLANGQYEPARAMDLIRLVERRLSEPQISDVERAAFSEQLERLRRYQRGTDSPLGGTAVG